MNQKSWLLDQKSWLYLYQKHKTLIEGAGEVAELLLHAKKGPLQQAYAGIKAVAGVAGVTFGDTSPIEVVRSLGYRRLEGSSNQLICELLHEIETPEVLFSDAEQIAVIWKSGIVAMYDSAQAWTSGPYYKDSNMLEQMNTELMGHLWEENTSLAMVLKPGDWCLVPRLRKVPFPDIYVGKEPPSAYADEIAMSAEEPRTVVLRGPTGVGKTVLAQYISKEIFGDKSRVLRISKFHLEKIEYIEILSLIDLVKPTTVLLDDVDLSDTDKLDFLLSFLESFRIPNMLVIITMMTMPEHIETAPKKGSWHFPGMRPGRIDQIFTLYLPGRKLRMKILQHYLKEYPCEEEVLLELTKNTKGFSGAYLKELARRLKVTSFSNPQKEVENLKFTIPNPDLK